MRRIRRDSSSITLPASVSDTLRCVRSRRRTPSSSSSLRICSLTAGCATCRRSAARRKCSSSATATKYLRWRSSMDRMFAFQGAVVVARRTTVAIAARDVGRMVPTPLAVRGSADAEALAARVLHVPGEVGRAGADDVLAARELPRQLERPAACALGRHEGGGPPAAGGAPRQLGGAGVEAAALTDPAGQRHLDLVDAATYVAGAAAQDARSLEALRGLAGEARRGRRLVRTGAGLDVGRRNVGRLR